MLWKVSNKKCNGFFDESAPHFFGPKGLRSLGGDVASQSLSPFPPSDLNPGTGKLLTKIFTATQKKETEVSLELSNFVLLK